MLITSPRQNSKGRWKMVEVSDEDSKIYRELCDCESGHATPEEAKDCPRVKSVTVLVARDIGDCADRCGELLVKQGDLQEAIREKDKEIARLREALQKILAWEFDLMGDCVADARRVAKTALLQES